MLIGVIGPQGSDDFADNLSASLDAMAMPNVRLGPARVQLRNRLVGAFRSAITQASPFVENQLQARLVERAIAAHCDIVITVDAALTPSSVRALQRARIKVVLWFPDHISNLGRQLMFVAGYDAIFLKEPRWVERMVSMFDLPASYLPEACNPSWHRPIGEPALTKRIVVAGNMYPSRLRVLEQLLEADVPLAIYGAGYPRWMSGHPSQPYYTGRYIVREEKARVFREAAAVLNNLHPGEIDGVNCRLFEAAGSGALVLAEYRSAIPDLFDVDLELATFRNLKELIELAKAVLATPQEFAGRADAASRRAHAEHTYQHRIREILERVA